MTTKTAVPRRPPTSVDLVDRPADLDQTLEATAVSLREFWAAELPRIYDKPFEDLAGGIQPKTKDSPPWTCNGERVTYHDIRGNAFYCGGPNDDYIAYDAASLCRGSTSPSARSRLPSSSRTSSATPSSTEPK